MLRKVAIAVALLGLTYFVFAVRLGTRTLAEHVHAIGQTREAKELANGAQQAVVPMLDTVRTRLLGERVETPRAKAGKPVQATITAESNKSKPAASKAAKSTEKTSVAPSQKASTPAAKTPSKTSAPDPALAAKLKPMPDVLKAPAPVAKPAAKVTARATKSAEKAQAKPAAKTVQKPVQKPAEKSVPANAKETRPSKPSPS